MLTDEERDELMRLEAAFEHAGGRGVELAERIDALRAKRDAGNHTYIVTVSDCTGEQADRVMTERLDSDEDYGFHYRLAWHDEELRGEAEVADPLVSALSPDEALDLLLALGEVIDTWGKTRLSDGDEGDREQMHRWQALSERIERAADWEGE